MTKRRRPPEMPPVERTPEQQATIARLRQQSLKALAERRQLPCPRCEQPLQASTYLHPILEGVNDVVLFCECGFREY